jgi:Pyridoxamine 5'-phosphate oxidase
VDVEQFLSQPLVARLAVTGKDGYPTVRPVWFLFEDGRTRHVFRTAGGARQPSHAVAAGPPFGDPFPVAPHDAVGT